MLRRSMESQVVGERENGRQGLDNIACHLEILLSTSFSSPLISMPPLMILCNRARLLTDDAGGDGLRRPSTHRFTRVEPCTLCRFPATTSRREFGQVTFTHRYHKRSEIQIVNDTYAPDLEPLLCVVDGKVLFSEGGGRALLCDTFGLLVREPHSEAVRAPYLRE